MVNREREHARGDSVSAELGKDKIHEGKKIVDMDLVTKETHTETMRYYYEDGSSATIRKTDDGKEEITDSRPAGTWPVEL